jgi:hypothetical protein
VAVFSLIDVDIPHNTMAIATELLLLLAEKQSYSKYGACTLPGMEDLVARRGVAVTTVDAIMSRRLAALRCSVFSLDTGGGLFERLL